MYHTAAKVYTDPNETDGDGGNMMTWSWGASDLKIKLISTNSRPWGLGSWGLGPGAWGLGSGVWGLGSGVWGLGSGVWGLGSGAWGLGSGVWGLGLGAWGPSTLGNSFILFMQCLSVKLVETSLTWNCSLIISNSSTWSVSSPLVQRTNLADFVFFCLDSPIGEGKKKFSTHSIWSPWFFYMPHIFPVALLHSKVHLPVNWVLLLGEHFIQHSRQLLHPWASHRHQSLVLHRH